MRDIYFDNSATTKISRGAMDKMTEVMEKSFGNPSSLHKIGLDAEHVVTEARNVILSTLGINRGAKNELVFTSGGTEANNMAILGVVFSKARRGNEKIMTTQGEHASVENAMAYLASKGFEIVRVPTKNGELDLDFVRENSRGCILASFMHVNNETGALYDVKAAFDIVRENAPGVVCHSDCVQSYMKTKLNKRTLGADLISLSAHKINGAKGTGALYIDPAIIKAKKIVPISYGGGQESGFRSGTENVYGIAAFGQAAREHSASLNGEIAEMQEIRDYIIDGLSQIEGVKVNIPKRSAPHIISITTEGIRSETMLHHLSSIGVYVSSGSACSSNSAKKVSGALTAFGLREDLADSTVRVSLCPQNTKEEADALIDGIKNALSRLARKS